MPLPLTDDHRALAGVVRSFAADHDLRGATRRLVELDGTDPGPVWRRAAQLGWAGLHLPEEYGGAGFGLPELAVVAEGLGAVPASGPLLSTAVVAAVVAEVGSPELRKELLPALADGSVAASIALGGTSRPGTVGPALGGLWADVHLAATGDDLVVLRDPTAIEHRERTPGLDPSLGFARLTLGAGSTTAEVLPGARPVATRLLRVLAAAEAAGGARACLDAAVEYAKVRQQFGRVIGGFQAVKHHLATMLLRAETAVAVAWDAARAGTGPAADLAAAVAAVVALGAYEHNARMAIQVHGGIAFTWEHDAHLHLRRATALAAVAGPTGDPADEIVALHRRGVRRRLAVELPPEADEHRARVRDFLAELAARPEPERRALWARTGYLVPHWPRPWGRAAGPVEQLVIEEELARADVEAPRLGIGGWVLLTLVQTASDEQRDRWIMPSLLGDLTWCQLFSEPEAGSDAAAVRLRGVRADGGWRLTGQKTWTSNAQRCNRGLSTVRTDPDAPKHRGITAMAVDLGSPGVTVRPLREITGETLFNEVFFDEVFVPDEDVVGAPGEGWQVARATLGNERTSIGGGGGGRRGLTAAALLPVWETRAPGDGGLARDLGELIAQEQAVRLLNLRAVERAVMGAPASAEGSVTKLLVAEQAQQIAELGMRIAGMAAVADDEPGLTHEYLFTRALTIAGGTSEVSRNVIAERILGLPREVGLR